MKALKRILAVVLCLALAFALAGCMGKNDKDDATTAPVVSGETTTEDAYNGEKVKVAAISGPTGMGMVNLMDSDRYAFTLTSDPTEIVSLISTKAVDIAACPLNLAANLYKKTGGNIKILGLNTLGVLYVVTNGVKINSLSELSGKTVYATGQGATPEYIINHLLDKNGLADSVKVEYLSAHGELATKLAAGEVEIAILPEPFVTVATSKNKACEVALSLTDEWNSVNSDTKLAMGCVIARSDFIEENPEAVERFISDNKASVEFVNLNALAASEKIVEKKIIDAAVFSTEKDSEKEPKAKDVIRRCNIVFIDGEELKSVADANFAVYYEADPTSVGGAPVSADIYYEAK